MKLNKFIAPIVCLLPCVASAHPGHDTNALHLHLGAPLQSNALDLRLTLAALVLAFAWQGVRAFRNR
jgi:hypothetical protein